MSRAPITPIDVALAGLRKRDRNAPPGKEPDDKPGWKEDAEQAGERSGDEAED